MQSNTSLSLIHSMYKLHKTVKGVSVINISTFQLLPGICVLFLYLVASQAGGRECLHSAINPAVKG